MRQNHASATVSFPGWNSYQTAIKGGRLVMNADFRRHMNEAPSNFQALMSALAHPYGDRSKFREAAGIYVLIEEGQPVYVGRTRNLAQRLRAHVSASHNSASYAVKRVRRKYELSPTYKPEMSRHHITTQEPWRSSFLEEIENIRRMQFRFLEVRDPIDQYLLELYATMELGLDSSGFDTH